MQIPTPAVKAPAQGCVLYLFFCSLIADTKEECFFVPKWAAAELRGPYMVGMSMRLRLVVRETGWVWMRSVCGIMVRLAKGLYHTTPCLDVRTRSGIALLYRGIFARATRASRYVNLQPLWFRCHQRIRRPRDQTSPRTSLVVPGHPSYLLSSAVDGGVRAFETVSGCLEAGQ